MPCHSVLELLLVVSFLRVLSSLLLCLSRQDGSQGPVPEARTTLGDIGAQLGVQASGMGGTVLTSPLPHHGPARFVHRTGLPPRRGDPLCSFLRRMPTPPSLPGPGREPRSQDAADRPHNLPRK